MTSAFKYNTNIIYTEWKCLVVNRFAMISMQDLNNNLN